MRESGEDQVQEESKRPAASSGPLKEQADWFRQRPQPDPEKFYERPLSAWQKFLYLILVFGVLFSVVFLLIATRSRQQLISMVASLYMDQQSEIYRLPPPPAKAIQTRVMIPAVSRATNNAADEPTGVLFLDLNPAARERDEAPRAPIVLAKSPANEAAYDFLLQASEAAGRLSENAISEFEFTAWRPMKEEPPEFWIDLVATRRSDGQEVHLIWSVNTESGEVAALSQAARDLEGANPL